MNFTSTILTACMIGLQAHAASDAFAAHKEALENILHEPVHHAPVYHEPVHHAAPVHHDTRHYSPEHLVTPHHNSLGGEHDYGQTHHSNQYGGDHDYQPHHNYTEGHHFTERPVHHANQEFEFDHYRPIEVSHEPIFHDAPAHASYDAFGHDYDTEHSAHISYRHHGDDEFHTEYSQSCGKKDYCHRFSRMLARDHHDEFTGHRRHDREEYYANDMKSNHLMTAYYVEPDSLVIHEDAIHA